jgi:hypothetical protein
VETPVERFPAPKPSLGSNVGCPVRLGGNDATMIPVFDGCTNCGNRVVFTHMVPKSKGLPELRSFRCYFCNEVVTKAAKEVVP